MRSRARRREIEARPVGAAARALAKRLLEPSAQAAAARGAAERAGIAVGAKERLWVTVAMVAGALQRCLAVATGATKMATRMGVAARARLGVVYNWATSSSGYNKWASVSSSWRLLRLDSSGRW